MRVPLAVLVGSLAVIADVAYQCADRVRASGGAADAVNDWAFATYLAVVVALGGAGWVAAAAIPAERRLRRLTRPIARYGAGAALVCGLGAVSVAGLGALAGGVGPGELWEQRYNLECFWLFGAAVGGLFGSAVGVGLGAAAYGSRRPQPAADPEQEHYREGPAAEPSVAPDRRPASPPRDV